jgi:CSLREA domain-containing protein
MLKPRTVLWIATSLFVVMALAQNTGGTLAGGGTTINVNTTADENNDDGDCSLREAVQAANGNSAADACPAGVPNGTGTDVINIPAGTYLTSELLWIASNTDIEGAGANSTFIDGGGTTGVFRFGTKGVVTATMTGLTVQNGSDEFGAGIDNLYGSQLLLQQSHVTNNTANCDGGGIRNGGSLGILNSAITNNHSLCTDSGGGIFNQNSLSVQTVVPSGIIGLVNVTLSGNTADNGGAIRNDGTATLIHVTVYDNEATVADGGLLNHGQMTLLDTIVAGSTGANCGGSEPIDSQGGNIEDTNTCGFDAAGDLFDTDPMVGPLQNNGGTTPTHALLAGSPAIDGGLTTKECPADDQRGVTRPIDGDGDGEALCDIGAYEAEPGEEPPPPPPGDDTIEGDVSDPNPDPGDTVDVTVTVLDENGAPVVGVACVFSILSQPGDDASLDSTEATTDENGQATVPLSVGSSEGTVEVQADCEGLTEVLVVNVGAAVLAPETGTGTRDRLPTGALGLGALLAIIAAASLFSAARRSNALEGRR